MAKDVRTGRETAYGRSLADASISCQVCESVPGARAESGWTAKWSKLGLLAEGFERRGMSPDEARRAARRAYGGVEQAKELHREARSFIRIEQLFKDVRLRRAQSVADAGFYGGSRFQIQRFAILGVVHT